MTNKQILRLRISVLYVVYIVALLGGVICNFGPEFERGANVGAEVSGNIFAGYNDDVLRASKAFIDIRATKDTDISTFELNDELNTVITMKASRFDAIVSQDADDKMSVFDIVFGSIGGSVTLYLGSLAIMFIYIAIIVLLFLIIHSLQRSVRKDLPLDKRCTRFTRIIGLLIIIAEMLSAFGQWFMSHEAAKVLAGTDFTVNTSFPLNYWSIMLAVLVIFTAEVFSIGSQLGEEQTLTI